MTEKHTFYCKLIENMVKHSFFSFSIETLNEIYMNSIGETTWLDLSTWRRDINDSIKLLTHPDFEFYREYIKHAPNTK